MSSNTHNIFKIFKRVRMLFLQEGQMIIKILLIILGICGFMYLRNEYVFKQSMKINWLIHNYHSNAIDNHNFDVDEMIRDYDAFNYNQVLLSVWIWNWRKMIPEDLVRKIERFE